MNKVGLGGSCHWCTEAVFQSLVGVSKVEQGWISSDEYAAMSEAVIVYFDSDTISLDVLIEVHLHTHSCTSTHRMREKYRSAVYVYNKMQRSTSIQIINSLQSQFEMPIITKVLDFDTFESNKEEYLDYYYNNPEKAFCKNQINPKLKKIMSMFAKRVDHSKLNFNSSQ